MMDLFQLRCFVAVSEELHFGKAATRLHMTQPPLSRQIQLLEESVGARLLERTSRSVRLTSAGAALYPDALKILRLADDAATAARLTARGDTGRVVVGYTAVAGYVLIPTLLKLAREALPGIDIVLEEMVSAEQFRALAAEALDLAFVRPMHSEAELDYHCVVREPMQLALPADHPLARRRRIALDDLAGQPLVMYSEKEGKYFHDKIKSLFVATGVQPHYVHHIGQTHTIMALVQAGIGLAIVPASAKHVRFENVTFRDLWRQDVVAEIYLAWRRAGRNPAQQRLREFIVEHLTGAAASG
ncbi:LysR family transcriptional regulator [Azohydromonas caseinilytica]